MQTSTRDKITNCDVTTIEWQRVTCPTNGNIKVQWKGDNHHWVGLYVYNVGGLGTLAHRDAFGGGIQLISRGGTWFGCKRDEASENYWLCHGGGALLDDYPYDIKFVDTLGRQEIGYDVVWSFSGTLDTGVNF